MVISHAQIVRGTFIRLTDSHFDDFLVSPPAQGWVGETLVWRLTLEEV